MLQQKKIRIGAVTRSLISSSNPNSNFSNAANSQEIAATTTSSTHSIQNTDNLTTVKVIGPTIMPITTCETKHFTKVCEF